MRVVIVSDFGRVNGGAAKVAIESARALAEAGVEVVFACAIGPVSERLIHHNIKIARFEGHEVWAVGSKWAAAKQGIWNAPAGAFLASLLASQPKGTVVHLHQWTKAFSPTAIAAAADSGFPVVITCHDYFSFCPVGGYFDFREGKPCQRAPMSLSCITRNCDRASYATSWCAWRVNGVRTGLLPVAATSHSVMSRILRADLPSRTCPPMLGMSQSRT